MYWPRTAHVEVFIVRLTIYSAWIESGASLEGEQGKRLLPQVFGTNLIEFQKKFHSVDPYYLGKNIFFAPLSSKC